MASYRKRLGDHLLSLKLITQEQLAEALGVQRESPAPLGSILVSLGFVSEDLLLSALAHQMGVAPWRLDEKPPAGDALAKLPGHVCRTYQVLPVELRGDLLILAMRNPHDLDAIDLVRNLTSLRVEPVLCDADRLLRAIDELSGTQSAVRSYDGLVNRALEHFNVDASQATERQDLAEGDTRPVVGLVNQILSDAIRMGASDVHIEPRADRVEVRYRVDGQMQAAREVPQALLPMLTTRLKIMAELDIVEFRVPQDGRVAVSIDGRLVDLRVSVLPNQHGQRIVLRILDKTVSLKKLTELGFVDDNLALFRTLIRKPYGMILVTGPTGSGKTTTLYAALQELRSGTTNIMTCEDPIEYEIDGINQSQVNEKVGLSFPTQLRATLRQDPDVILVGEIRDGETAQTAIRASLTGHLVLSTLHCNDAPSAIPRLLDMGVDPFLLSTSLIGVMSQRLVRTVCRSCRERHVPTREEMALLGNPTGLEDIAFLATGKGCRACGETGFKGRTAVHEIMPITAEVARSIVARESLESVRLAAAKAGYEPMQVRAAELVLAGRTTLAEATRQVYFDTDEGLPQSLAA